MSRSLPTATCSTPTSFARSPHDRAHAHGDRLLLATMKRMKATPMTPPVFAMVVIISSVLSALARRESPAVRVGEDRRAASRPRCRRSWSGRRSARGPPPCRPGSSARRSTARTSTTRHRAVSRNPLPMPLFMLYVSWETAGPGPRTCSRHPGRRKCCEFWNVIMIPSFFAAFARAKSVASSMRVNQSL